MNPERPEEAGGDHEAAQTFRFSRAGEVVILIAVHGNRGEGACVVLPVEEIQIGDRAAIDARSSSVDGEELAGLLVGERI